MTQKTNKIINWGLTGIIGLIFIGSAFGKLTGDATTVEMAAKWGINSSQLAIIGVIELIAFILFAIPRTTVIGALLLVAYMGGAIATHLEHQIPMTAPIAISIFLWITIFIKIPEFRSLIFKNNSN
jgi:uncharacterized membrane protein YphA (DoxX/SURF4 family)